MLGRLLLIALVSSSTTIGCGGSSDKTGPTGPAGATGSAGSAGATGATGSGGLGGAPGPTGATGAAGATGSSAPTPDAGQADSSVASAPRITWVDRHGTPVPGVTAVSVGGTDLIEVLYFDSQGDTWFVNTINGTVVTSAGSETEWWASNNCTGTGLVSIVASYIPNSTVVILTATDTEYHVVPNAPPPATSSVTVPSSGTGLTCNTTSTTTINGAPLATAYPTTTTLPDLSAYSFPLHPVYGP